MSPTSIPAIGPATGASAAHLSPPASGGGSSAPFISVCVLTYKRAHVLAATLDSILTQTHRNYELIINDDNSPDHTEAVAREYERKDPRVCYFKNSINLRYAGNQNAAIARARGDYVAILHDGDIYRPDLLEKWVNRLHAQPSAAIVFNALEEMDDNGRVHRVHRHPYGPSVPGRELLCEMLTRPDSPIFGIVMVRRSHLLSVGSFDTSLPTLADIDMWMRLLSLYDAAYVSEPLIRIAGREVDHHNRIGNWEVRGQHEAIHMLNLARLEDQEPVRARELRPAVVRMLWKVRLHWLFWLLARNRLRQFGAGLAYCGRFFDLATVARHRNT